MSSVRHVRWLSPRLLLACLIFAALAMLPLFVSSLFAVNPATGLHEDRFVSEDAANSKPAPNPDALVANAMAETGPVGLNTFVFRDSDMSKMMEKINGLTVSADLSTLSDFTITAKVGTNTCEMDYRELKRILDPLRAQLNQLDNPNMIQLQQQAILELAAHCDSLLLNAYARVLEIKVADEDLDVTWEPSGESSILTVRAGTFAASGESQPMVRRLILDSTNPPADGLRRSFLDSCKTELMAAAISKRLPDILTDKQLLSAELQQYKKVPTMENFYAALRALSEFTIHVPQAQSSLLTNLALKMLRCQIKITKA